jgi:uridine phosphorylase
VATLLIGDFVAGALPAPLRSEKGSAPTVSAGVVQNWGMHEKFYHVGFGLDELGPNPPTAVLLSGDPDRSEYIATAKLKDALVLSTNRGLTSYAATLPNGRRVLCSTSGMGGPSTSIVLNELTQLGIKTVIRIGTTGSIQRHVRAGAIVVSASALCRQGAALDVAPVEFPAVADPFVTVELVNRARELGFDVHVGMTASVDTFFEGQERTTSSANPNLQRWLRGITDEYRALGILNYEMESATLFKIASVYGLRAGCVCAVIAQRTEGENVVFAQKEGAVDAAIDTAVAAVQAWA